MAKNSRKKKKIASGLIGAWSVFKRSKKGLLGVAIILVFTVTSTLAPLLTPYDPMHSRYLAGPRAKPLWLGGVYGGLPENVEPIVDWAFATSNSVNEWIIESPSIPSYNMQLKHNSNLGFGENGNLGCMEAEISKTSEASSINSVTFTTEHSFDFPYNFPPARFAYKDIALFIDADENVTVEIDFFIKDPEGNRHSIWTLKSEEGEVYEKEFTAIPMFNLTGEKWLPSGTNNEWVIPCHPVDSFSSYMKMRYGGIQALPTHLVFTENGEYSLGIEFIVNSDIENQYSVHVFLDNLNFRLYGDAFGIFGTDQFGRDVFTQLIYGSRNSLLVGLLTAFISVSIGLIVGLVSGFLGGLVDEVLMRFTDMLLVLPFLPLVLVAIAVLGSSIWNTILLMALLSWMSFSRIVRSQVLSLKERPFIESAKAIGASTLHIIVKHVLPNVMSFVYVALALNVPTAIVLESVLSWLGLGDPRTMTWGMMLHDVQFFGAYEDWWWVVPPGISITLLSLAFVLIGFAIDEMLNPKLRKR